MEGGNESDSSSELPDMTVESPYRSHQPPPPLSPVEPWSGNAAGSSREYYEFDVEKACDTESEVELNLLSESDASSSGSVNRGEPMDEDFQCVMEVHCILKGPLERGQRLCIRAGMEELNNWERPCAVLRPLDSNDKHFVGRWRLPFPPVENRGRDPLLEFKYTIERASRPREVIFENLPGEGNRYLWTTSPCVFHMAEFKAIGQRRGPFAFLKKFFSAGEDGSKMEEEALFTFLKDICEEAADKDTSLACLANQFDALCAVLREDRIAANFCLRAQRYLCGVLESSRHRMLASNKFVIALLSMVGYCSMRSSSPIELTLHESTFRRLVTTKLGILRLLESRDMPASWTPYLRVTLGRMAARIASKSSFEYVHLVPFLHLAGEDSKDFPIPRTAKSSMKVLRTTFRRLMQDLDVEELRSGFFDTYVALMEHLAQISPTLDCTLEFVDRYAPLLGNGNVLTRCRAAVRRNIGRLEFTRPHLDDQLNHIADLATRIPDLLSQETVLNLLENELLRSSVVSCAQVMLLLQVTVIPAFKEKTVSEGLARQIANCIQRLQRSSFSKVEVVRLWRALVEEIPACAEHDRLFWGFLCSSASLDRDSPIIQLQELMRLDFVSDLGPVFSTMAFQHAVHLVQSLPRDSRVQGMRLLENARMSEEHIFHLFYVLLPIPHAELENASSAANTVELFADVLVWATSAVESWLLCFKWFQRKVRNVGLFKEFQGRSFSEIPDFKPRFGTVMAYFLSELVRVSAGFVDESISLKDVRKIAPHANPFANISQSVSSGGVAPVQASQVEAAAAVMRDFDERLEQVGYFVNIFSQPCRGCRIDVRDMEEDLARVTRNADQLSILEAKQWGTSSPIKKFFPWFSFLRGCQMFLSTWGASFEAFARKRRNRGGLDAGAVEEGASEDEGDSDSESEDPGARGSDSEESDSDEAPLGLGSELSSDSEGAGDGAGPSNAVPRRRISGRQLRTSGLCVFSIEEVIEDVIPAVNKAWKDLYKDLTAMTMSGTMLNRVLVNRVRENDWVLELESLARTNRGALLPKSHAIQQWVAERMSSIFRYRDIVRKKDWIPALIAFSEIMHDRLQIPLSQDFLHISFKNLEAMFGEGWKDRQVSEILGSCEVLDAQLTGFPEAHVRYLQILTGNTDLVTWLRKQDNSDSFNSSMNVCRGSTDDPMTVQALGAISVTRNFLQEIMYHQRSFHSCSELLGAFTRQAITEEIVQALDVSSQRIDTILRVFGRAIQSEGVQACHTLKEVGFRGSFLLSMESLSLHTSIQGDEIVSCVVSGAGSVTLTFHDLEDLRNKLMLVEVPEELQSQDDYKTMILEFVAKFQVVCKLKDVLFALCRSGHFEYQPNVFPGKIFRVDNCVQVFEEYLQRLTVELDEWNTHVAVLRETYYFLNYFNMSQLLELDRCLCHLTANGLEAVDWPAISRTLRSLLALVHPQIDDAMVQLTTLDHSIWRGRKPPQKRLKIIGKRLSDIYTQMPLQNRALHVDAPEFVPYLLNSDERIRQCGRPVALCCADSADRVLEVVLSLYSSVKHVPEPDELLFCTHGGNYEDVNLLLRRWVGASTSDSREVGRVYCIANVELLTYHQQCQLMEDLRILMQGNIQPRTVLVLVSGVTNNLYLKSALARCVTGFELLSQDALARVCKEISTRYSSGIISVSSKKAGCGKSDFALRWIYDLSMEGYRLLAKRVALREGLSALTLITALSERQAEVVESDDICIAYHMDISPSAPRLTNLLLFELLLVGVVQDRKTGQLFVRSPRDAFVMEVASTPNGSLLQKLSICQMMEHVEINGVENGLLGDIPILDLETSSIRLVRNKYMQFTVKYLQAFDENEFDCPKQLAEGEVYVDPGKRDDVPPAECFEVLMRHIESEHLIRQRITFATIATFCRVMYRQFRGVSRYPLLDNSFMVDEFRQFKHWFVKFLISTTNKFVGRSMMTIEEAERKSGAASVARDGPAIGGASGSRARLHDENMDFMQGVENLDMAEMQYSSLKHWNSSEFPVACFKYDRTFSDGTFCTVVAGLDIISLRRNFVEELHPALVAVLAQNGIDLNFDWMSIQEDQPRAVRIIRHVAGVRADVLPPQLPEDMSGYCLTIDNMLKMLSILIRVRCGIPTIIMGETGCGKSELVRFLCHVIEAPLYRLNIHGGIKDADILSWVRERMQESQFGSKVYLFFDEVNTTTMGLLKEIICDHCMDGVPLPRNLRIIAACNPYRIKRHEEDEANRAGLVFQYNMGESAAPDPLERLVYRVYPLPEIMLEYAFDYGSLDAQVEKSYMHSKLKCELQRGIPGARVESLIDTFLDALVASHEFMRTQAIKDPSAVSLRDVSRAIQLFKFFCSFLSLMEHGHIARSPATMLEELSKCVDGSDFRSKPLPRADLVRTSLVLALSHCYESRLSDLRQKYRAKVCTEAFSQSRDPYFRVDAREFSNIVHMEQKIFARRLGIHQRPSIALNKALCENLFMIFVSVLNKIPIFVVGKPGSSKSLAVELLESSFSGDSSPSPFARSFPAIILFRYQCSPLSTAHGIAQTFSLARKYEHPNTIVAVLLDEVGLAEQSPHLPLKVLHAELERSDRLSVIGLSNWTLDPAKINRGTLLTRPAPSEKELEKTASGIMKDSNTDMERYLGPLTKAYFGVYKRQTDNMMREFFGLRDFYSILKDVSERRFREGNLSPDILIQAVRRNFGGKPRELDSILGHFFDALSLPIPENQMTTVVDLIKQNMEDKNARHLMLLTKNNAALDILFSQELVARRDRTEVLFGSDFPEDKSDLQICLNIQKFKLCMAEGWTVILVHCENLFESLYDVLNQHYVELPVQDKIQRFVRIALGNNNRLCTVHESFRVIVVVDREQAYNVLPPPLLNRFEKQVLLRKDILSQGQQDIVSELRSRMSRMCRLSPGESSVKVKRIFAENFPGYHADFLSSLVLSASNARAGQRQRRRGAVASSSSGENRHLFDRCFDTLLQVATPEVILRSCSLPDTREFSEECRRKYFDEQSHDSLVDFIVKVLNSASATDYHPWGDRGGILSLVTTFSPLLGDADVALRNELSGHLGSLVVLKLHEFSSESSLTSKITQFFEDDSPEQSMLIIQCDPGATSSQRVTHVKYIVQNIRGRHLRVGQETAPRHLLVVVHENRSRDSLFEFDFDPCWGFCFVDSVSDSEDFGPINNLLTQNLAGLVDSLSEEKLRRLLQQTFRIAFSKLKYPNDRSLDEICQKINLLRRLLEQHETADLFAKSLRAEIHAQQQASQDRGIDSMSWKYNVASDRAQLCFAGSFREALAERIRTSVADCLARILSLMDRDNNLAFLDEEDEPKRRLWFALWRNIQECRVSPKLFERNMFAVEMPLGGDQHLGFPFSSIVAQVLAETRDHVENTGNTLAILEQHVGGKLPVLLDPRMCTEEMVSLFLRDYLSLHPLTSEHGQQDFCAIFLRITEGREVFESICALQFALWKHATSLEMCTRIFAAIPGSMNDFVNQIGLLEDVLGNRRSVQALSMYMLMVVLYRLSPDFRDPDRDPIDALPKDLDLLWRDLSEEGGEAERLKGSPTWARSVENWVLQVSRIHRPLNYFLRHVDRIGEGEKLLVMWRRVQITECFVREVCMPLGLPRCFPQIFWAKSGPSEGDEDGDCIGSMDIDVGLVKTTTLLSTMLSLWRPKESACLLCECEENLLSPRLCQCALLVCRDCAMRVINRGNNGEGNYQACFHCNGPRPRSVDEDFGPPPMQAEAEQARCAEIRQERLMKERCSLVLDYFLRNLWDLSHVGPNQPECTRKLLELALNGKLRGDQCESSLILKLPTRMMILHRILREFLQEERVPKPVSDSLVAELQRSYRSARVDSREKAEELETESALLVCHAFEDLYDEYIKDHWKRFGQNLGELGALLRHMVTHGQEPLWTGRDAMECLHQVDDGSVLATVESIAFVRSILSLYAQEICAGNARRAELDDLANVLLGGEAAEAISCVQNLRFLVLKILQHERGDTSARELLHNLQQENVEWVMQWANADHGLMLYMKVQEALPCDSPFRFQSPWDQLYLAACEVLNAALVNGNTTPLEQLADANRGDSRFSGALLLAVFQTVQSRHVMEVTHRSKRNINAIGDALGRLQLPHGPQFSAFLSHLAKNDFECRGASGWKTFFVLRDNTTNLEKLQLRVIYHVMCLGLLSTPNNLFSSVLFEANQHANGYWPTMPSDERKAIMEAAHAEARARGETGSWNECPNGHRYFIGNCGQAMERRVCSEPGCNAEIGGEAHQLLGNNRVINASAIRPDNPPGICLRSVELEAAEPHLCYRGLTPTTFRALRVLSNSALLCAALVFDDQGLHGLVNRAFERPPSLGEFLRRHIQSDIRMLGQLLNRSEEEACWLLHGIMNVLGREDRVQAWAVANPLSEDGRVAFENAMRAQIGNTTDQVAQYLQQARNFQNEEEAPLAHVRNLIAEHEQPPVEELPRFSFRGQLRYRKPFSLDMLQAELRKSEINQIQFPLVYMVASQFGEVSALPYLPAVIGWQRLMVKHVHLRLDRTAALNLHVGDFLDDFENPDTRKELTEAFRQLKQGWEKGWPYVTRFECHDIAELYRDIRMDEETTISMCSGNTKDESICMLAFLNHYVGIYNKLLREASKAQLRLVHGRPESVEEHEQRLKQLEEEEEGRLPSMSSASVDLSRIMSDDIATEMLRFAHDHSIHSLSYGDGDIVHMDFAALEEFLVSRFFAGQELIDFKMQEVVFVDEQERSMMDHLTTLRTKLDVEDLPPHHLERIRMEVDLDGARQLRRLANTCASFISGMGRMHSGSGLGDMSMKGYLMDILRMEHNMEVMELQSVGDSVLLKHIPSLIGMLEQLLASNPMEDISPAFKAALPVELMEQLRQCLPHMNVPVLLDALRNLGAQSLGLASDSDPSLYLRNFLDYTLDQDGQELSEFQWYNQNFPHGLQLCHFAKTYEFFVEHSDRE